MIKIKKTLQFNGTPPYAYSWISSDPCLMFLNDQGNSAASGTTIGNSVTTTLSFQDSACIDTTDVSIRVVDKNGCIALIPVLISDPCENFLVNPIQLVIDLNSEGKQRFTYTANVSGGVPNYSYLWAFNGFSEAPESDPNNGVLILVSDNDIPFNASLDVTLIVTDAAGCQKEVRKNYTLCTPIANSVSYQACRREGLTIMSSRQIMVGACNNSVANWSTIEFICPIGVSAVVSSFTGNTAFINISFQTTLASNINDITWTVFDTNGVESTVGMIHTELIYCTNTNLPVQSFNYTFPCSPTLPENVVVDLDDPIFPYVNSDCDIDWSSFTFVAQSGQTLVNPTNVTTPNGNATLNIDHELTYNYTTLGTGTETIAWKVKDMCGIWSNTAYFFFVLDCVVAPVAIDDTACASCGVPVLIDVLSNDTGDYNPNTLTITTGPTNGNAIVQSGKILYTPNILFSGVDTFEYQVSGFDPNSQSNLATVTITVICAGNSQTTVTCN